MNEITLQRLSTIIERLITKNIHFVFSYGVDGIPVFNFTEFGYKEAKKALPKEFTDKAKSGYQTAHFKLKNGEKK